MDFHEPRWLQPKPRQEGALTHDQHEKNISSLMSL